MFCDDSFYDDYVRMIKVSFWSHDSGLYFSVLFFSVGIRNMIFFFCGGIQGAARFEVDSTFNKIIQLPQDCVIVQAFRCLKLRQIQICMKCVRAWSGTGEDFPQRFFGSHLQTLIPPLLLTSVSLCRGIDQTAHFHIVMLCKLKISTLSSTGLLADWGSNVRR